MRQVHPEARQLLEDTLVLACKEHLEALSMLCVRLVSVGVGEVYAFRLVGRPIVTIRIGGIVVKTAKLDILSGRHEGSRFKNVHVGLPS